MNRMHKTTLILLLGASGLLSAPSVFGGGPPSHALAHSATLQGDWSGLPAQDEPEFGFSVAVDEGWLAVGAPQSLVDGGAFGVGRHGAVFLYRFEAGQWQFQQRLIFPQYGVPQCGFSVAMDVPWLAVGCPGADYEQPAGDPGLALLYRLDAVATWQLQFARFGLPAARCGSAVAIREDPVAGNFLLALGCPGRFSGTGQVPLYDVSQNDATRQTTLTANDGASGDHFGESLSLRVVAPAAFEGRGVLASSFQLAVGAPDHQLTVPIPDGKVYVFSGDANGWSQDDSVERLLLGQLRPFDFGEDVALRGNTLVVGSPGFPACADDEGCGAAFRYALDPLQGTATLAGITSVEANDNVGGNPPGAQGEMYFGQALALGFNDLLAVSAPSTDAFDGDGNLALNVGYVELRDAHAIDTRLGEIRPVPGPDSLDAGHFGASLDFGDNFLAVGYPDSGTVTSGRLGSVYIYRDDRIFADGFE